MPRLKGGEEHVPGPPVPEGTKPTDELFVVRTTGEGVKSYEEYLRKLHLYRRKEWQNAVTGKGQFTYEEALEDEKKSLAQLAKVRAARADDYGGFRSFSALQRRFGRPGGGFRMAVAGRGGLGFSLRGQDGCTCCVLLAGGLLSPMT